MDSLFIAGYYLAQRPELVRKEAKMTMVGGMCGGSAKYEAKETEKYDTQDGQTEEKETGREGERKGIDNMLRLSQV